MPFIPLRVKGDLRGGDRDHVGAAAVLGRTLVGRGTTTGMKLAPTTLAILAVGLLACEKDATPRSKPSGSLNQQETGLLSKLPSGGQFVFGGNMYDAQRWLSESPMAQMTRALVPANLTAWNECLATQKQMAMAMAGRFEDGTLRMSTFMRGITIADLQRCAGVAKVTVAVDPDGKYLTVDLPAQGGVTMRSPYLEVDGGLYSRMAMSLAGLTAGAVESVVATRAELEADQASLAKGSMATDARMQELLARVDRSRPFFFAGSAAGTPIADKLGDVWGSFAVERGLEFDGVFALKDPAMTQQMLDGFGDLKSNLGSLPPSMSSVKTLVKGVRLGKSKDGLTLSVRISNQALADAMAQLGPMLPQVQ
jgi:hypothetical protein